MLALYFRYARALYFCYSWYVSGLSGAYCETPLADDSHWPASATVIKSTVDTRFSAFTIETWEVNCVSPLQPRQWSLHWRHQYINSRINSHVRGSIYSRIDSRINSHFKGGINSRINGRMAARKAASMVEWQRQKQHQWQRQNHAHVASNSTSIVEPNTAQFATTAAINYRRHAANVCWLWIESRELSSVFCPYSLSFSSSFDS